MDYHDRLVAELMGEQLLDTQYACSTCPCYPYKCASCVLEVYQCVAENPKYADCILSDNCCHTWYH